MLPKFLQRVAVLTILSAPACVIPTASRTNARVSPGTTVGLFAGVQAVEASTSTDGDEGREKPGPYIEVDTQYGHSLGNDQAIAVQLKVPIAFPYSSIDLYYQFLDAQKSAMGVGVEVSVVPSVYAVFTQNLGSTLFVTFTPRVYFPTGYKTKTVLNPQLAVGILDNSGVEITALLSLAHHLGSGENFAIDGLELNQDGTDLRRNFLLSGVSARW